MGELITRGVADEPRARIQTPEGEVSWVDVDDDSDLHIHYEAEPTLVDFHADNSLVRGVMGPIGSGKSSACVMEVLKRGLQQKLWRGMRKARCAIVRNTFPMLRSTTIQTWQYWVPPEICRIVYHSPIEGNIKEQPIEVSIDGESAWMEGSPHGFEMANGEVLDLEVWFFALDRIGDLKRLLSLELTFAWVNEARELPYEVVRGVLSRCGRYPAKRDGGMSWHGVFMDTNPPPMNHWWYRTFEQEKPKTWRIWKQPGALIRRGKQYLANPRAENVQHQALGYRYWTEQVPGARSQWIKVNVLGDYGVDLAGRPVYEGTWNDERHVSGVPLTVWRGVPLRIGWDFGLTPACIIGQLLPTGVLQILRELICPRGGVGQFCEDVVLPLLANEFSGMEWIIDGDPSGAPHADLPDVLTPIKEVRDLGMDCQAAVTNDIVVRIDSVNYFLQRWPNGEPGFLLDPSCVILRQGFLGMYHFARLNVVTATEERYRDKPEKDSYSHPHDALQYLCMRARGVNPEDVRQIRDRAQLAQGDTWGAFR